MLFPPLWSFVAIYQLDNFLLAAGPAVAFLSIATLWTGWTFFRYYRIVGSTAAGVLTVTLPKARGAKARKIEIKTS